MKRICVFTGSSPGAGSEYAAAARNLAKELVTRNLELVYGGARVGLMGTLADSVLELGGGVIGVIPEALSSREVAHSGLSDLRVMNSMHERKAEMADLASGFIALPGGVGIHAKPCGLLNISGYFNSLLEFLEHSVRERFLKPSHQKLLLVEETAGELLDAFSEYSPIQIDKWIDRENDPARKRLDSTTSGIKVKDFMLSSQE